MKPSFCLFGWVCCLKCCVFPLGPPATFQLAPGESPSCWRRGLSSLSVVHMLLYYCLFALAHISSLDGFSIKIIPTCLIFNFRSHHFPFEYAFFYRCFFWQNNFLWASADANGTFIYYHRQLQFLGVQLSCAVVHRRNKSSCNFGHFTSHLWPQRRREAENIGHICPWSFLHYQFEPQPGVLNTQKNAQAPSSNSFVLQKNKPMSKAHTHTVSRSGFERRFFIHQWVSF